ncbi:ATP-binding cassette domain-containing protein, partial [Clostridioides difficile]|uniref:ATP-binding cassette domain-containing protein n=1 Tax=Clostridioides difficile TaxID=1496 RepID=UPI001035028A
MISLINISKKFKDKSIIDKFNLEISKGEFVAITGNSGSGKTTLLNIMGLLEKPTSGAIILNNIKNPNSKQLRI